MSASDKTPAQRVDAILAEAVGRDLTSWERHEFLPNIRVTMFLTVNQERVLRGIEKKLFQPTEK